MRVMKSKRCKGTRLNEIKPGDLVLRKDPRVGMNAATKLNKAFVGPYEVKKVLPTGVALVKSRVGKKIKQMKIPLRQLKLAKAQ